MASLLQRFDSKTKLNVRATGKSAFPFECYFFTSTSETISTTVTAKESCNHRTTPLHRSLMPTGPLNPSRDIHLKSDI